MKAISLWQPWASLWVSPRKIHETRHWSTNYRGWLLVHAAKRRIDDVESDILGKIVVNEFGPNWALELPRGAIVGMVNLIACIRTDEINGCSFPKHFAIDDWHCGDFSDGRFAWQRAEYKVFKNPVPYRGSQGFFDVPDALSPRSWV